MRKNWIAYDPGWLVALASTEPSLAVRLSECKRAYIPNSKMIYFVDGEAPNRPGSEWQFDRNVMLETPDGTLIFDVLKDGRIGAVELIFYHGPGSRARRNR